MLSIFLILLCNLPMNTNVEKPKLIYVGDPMCSWCYGISEELSRTVEHFEDQLEVEIVLGGLRAGGGDKWNDQFKSFLRHHWEDVGMKSGQPFSFKLLDLEQFEYDTEPACRAVVVVKQLAPDKALAFFKEIQKRFYQESMDPKSIDFYQPLCEKMNIDFSTFSSNFDSDDAKIDTKHNFYRSRKLGVNSFPTILLEKEGKVHRIDSGYSTFEEMRKKIEALIQ